MKWVKKKMIWLFLLKIIINGQQKDIKKNKNSKNWKMIKNRLKNQKLRFLIFQLKKIIKIL